MLHQTWIDEQHKKHASMITKYAQKNEPWRAMQAKNVFFVDQKRTKTT